MYLRSTITSIIILLLPLTSHAENKKNELPEKSFISNNIEYSKRTSPNSYAKLKSSIIGVSDIFKKSNSLTKTFSPICSSGKKLIDMYLPILYLDGIKINSEYELSVDQRAKGNLRGRSPKYSVTCNFSIQDTNKQITYTEEMKLDSISVNKHFRISY